MDICLFDGPFYQNANRERDYLLLSGVFLLHCSAHFWVLWAKNIPPSMANMNYEQWVHSEVVFLVAPRPFLLIDCK